MICPSISSKPLKQPLSTPVIKYHEFWFGADETSAKSHIQFTDRSITQSEFFKTHTL